jgi:SIR2-like domain
MSELDDETQVFTNHNVYVLGAGFSKNAGLPVLKDFLNEMRSSVNWLKREKRPELAATRDVLLFRKSAASAALRINMNVENIEDLFSLAAASGEESEANNISNAIAATIEYCHQHAVSPAPISVNVTSNTSVPPSWKKTKEGDETKHRFTAELYDLYAGFLSGQLCDDEQYMHNTVITFNYDTQLEGSLLNIGVPIDYGFGKSNVAYDESWNKAQGNNEKLTVLKIHGSVNWFQNDRELGDLTVYRSYNDGYSKDANPYYRVIIVPPTWRKDFSGPLSDVWRSAIQALRSATRIIFLGFSFPDTDSHIKYLLAAGLQENISLRNIYCANPDVRVKKSFFRIVKRDLERQSVAEFHPIYASHLLNRFARQRVSYASLFNRSISNKFSIEPFTLRDEEGTLVL